MLSRAIRWLWFGALLGRAVAAEPIPDRLVVLTFDDSSASHFNVVRPLLKQLGFGATFFITEGFTFQTNKRDYLTWPQIKQLHDEGFEIGNHTRDHLGVAPNNLGQLREQVEAINERCDEYGIPRPVSFSYPGNAIVPGALPILEELGFRFARRGGAPEQPYDWGRGFAYEPGRDHPLLLPSAGDARPDWTLDDFKRAADQARDGRIAILQFHGVPDGEHPWVNTRPDRFVGYLNYLATNQFKVVALQDLARYEGTDRRPENPRAIIQERQAQRIEFLVEGEVVDAGTGDPIPARLYIEGPTGRWFFPKSAHALGSAIPYERRNTANTNAVEAHSTLSPHPFKVELPAGRYRITAERGPEWFPETREVEVKEDLPRIRFALRRLTDMARQGWYSGDGHHHRNPQEVAQVMLAEDVNVSLPMMDWTTVSTVSPGLSSQSFPAAFGSQPVVIDATHAWHPRNSEYEIFRTGTAAHTLGAVLVLNHRERLTNAVFPLAGISNRAQASGALLDLEKHNWPWSIAVVPILGVDLFELANNHHWRTEYAARNWAVPAPEWMGVGTGTQTEREWTLYGFQTYYALLNCGFPLRPSAGSGNGVHPVPLGFSRVYVHLDGAFSYGDWMQGLAAGRSFVTTGPMLQARAGGAWPGTRFSPGSGTNSLDLEASILSQQPLESVELIVNGEVRQRFEPANEPTANGGFQNQVRTDFRPTGSCWWAWRCFERRPGERIRFAHTAPWYWEVPGEPLRPRKAEAAWLVTRVKEEIVRSQGIAPEELLQEYRQALEIYERISDRAR